MDNDLVISKELEAIAPLVPSQEQQARSTTANTNFLPVIKLIHSVSDNCGQEVKGIDGTPTRNSEGTFFLTSKDVNLGERVKIHVIHRRSHAMIFKKNSKESESFNPESPIFRDIENTPSKKDRSVVSLHGDDWLFWLPDAEEFCTYFPSTNTARPVSRDIFDYVADPELKRQAAKDLVTTRSLILYSKFENKGGNFKCYIPKIEPNLEPIATLPSKERMLQVLNMFLKPVQEEGKVEEVTEEDDR